MNSEKVDVLYAKLGKSVPKSKRAELKNSLEAAENSKYSALGGVTFASRSPIKGTTGLTAFFATLLGTVFIICSLLAFTLLSPKFNSYGKFYGKIADDMGLYYAQTAEYGKVSNGTGEASGEDGEAATAKTSVKTVFFTGDEIIKEFNKIFVDKTVITPANGNQPQKEQTEFEKFTEDYEKKYSEYVSDVDYVNSKTENYLKYAVELASLTEPAVGAENYEALKAEYDADKKNCEDKIAEYESKEQALTEKAAEIETYLTKLNAYVSDYERLVDGMNEQLVSYCGSSSYVEGLKNAFGASFSDTEGLIAYMNSCVQTVETHLSDYEKHVEEYAAQARAASELNENIPADIEADLQSVKEFYGNAKSDLTAFLNGYRDLKLEFDGFVAENADNYNNAVASDIEENKVWLAEYEAKVKSYGVRLSGYAKITDMLGLNGYFNKLVREAQLNAQIEETNKKIEAEAEESKKTALIADRDRLSGELSTCKTELDELKKTVDVFNEIFTSSDWTVEYYANYCKNSVDDENFAITKKTFETIADTESAVGSGGSDRAVYFKNVYDLGIANKNVKQNERDGAVSYYSAEQLLMRLQMALNMTPELLKPVSNYYATLQTADKLDWLEIDTDMRKRVLNDLSVSSYGNAVDAYIKNYTATEIDSFRFADYDVTEKQTALLNLGVFTGKISSYTSVTQDMNKIHDASVEKVNDYKYANMAVQMAFITFGCILAVLFACYFVFLIYEAASEAKEKNYENIKKILSE